MRKPHKPWPCSLAGNMFFFSPNQPQSSPARFHKPWISSWLPTYTSGLSTHWRPPDKRLASALGLQLRTHAYLSLWQKFFLRSMISFKTIFVFYNSYAVMVLCSLRLLSHDTYYNACVFRERGRATGLYLGIVQSNRQPVKNSPSNWSLANPFSIS